MIRESYFIHISETLFDKLRDDLDPYLTLEFRSKFKDLLKDVVDGGRGLKVREPYTSVRCGSYDLDTNCLNNFLLEIKYSFNLNTILGPEYKNNPLVADVCKHLFSNIAQEVYPFIRDYTLKNPYKIYSDLDENPCVLFDSIGLPTVALTFFLYDQNELDSLNYKLEDDPRVPAVLKNLYINSKSEYISRERTRLIKEKETHLKKEILPDVPKMVDWVQKYIESHIKDMSPRNSFFNAGGQFEQHDFWTHYHRYHRLTYDFCSLYRNLLKEFKVNNIEPDLFESVLTKVESKINANLSKCHMKIDIIGTTSEDYLVYIKVDHDITNEFKNILANIRK